MQDEDRERAEQQDGGNDQPAPARRCVSPASTVPVANAPLRVLTPLKLEPDAIDDAFPPLEEWIDADPDEVQKFCDSKKKES